MIGSISGATALQVLRATSNDISVAQTRIATGLRVSSAKDDPYAWSVAQSLRSDNAGANAIMTSLAGTATQARITGAALEEISKTLVELRGALTRATADGADKAAIQVEVEGLQERIKSAVASGSYGTKNWMTGSATSASVVLSETKTGGAATLNETTVDLANVRMINGAAGILDKAGTASTLAITAFDVTSVDAEAVGEMLTDLATAIVAVDKGASSMASTLRIAEGQSQFLKTISGIRETAIGKLVNADVPEETARLRALEVREQLATVALSIANSSQSNVLALFR